MTQQVVPVTYDLEKSQKIPNAWRKTINAIVECFKARNLKKINEIIGVEVIDLAHAKLILDNIDDYGCQLVSLPEETWDSSECMYTGDAWQVTIDLYTKEEGRSDLVLDLVVFLIGEKEFLFQIDNIYVP